MFVGVGASRVRSLLVLKKQPAIIFIDEIDAVERQRGVECSGGNDEEREQTLNQLWLRWMVLKVTKEDRVIAATNRSDVLDCPSRPWPFWP